MKKTLAFFAILFCISLFFFWPIFKGYLPFPGDLLVNTNPYNSLTILGFGPSSYPTKEQGEDVIAELYPWKHFAISEIKQGRIPFWDPYNFSGNVLMQNFQSAVFNPVNIIFLLLSFKTSWTIFILIQPIMASFFFFLLSRELKIGRFAALIGSIGFAFSSYMTVWVEYGNISSTLSYLPLLLYFILKFLKTKKLRFYSLFILSGILTILSGYIQGAFYCYLVAISFTLFVVFKEKIKLNAIFLLQLFLMFIFPVLLTMFQVYSTYQIFRISTRWPYSVAQFRNMLQPIWYWVTLFASDFFGNPATRNYFPAHSTYIERVAYFGIPLVIFSIFALFVKSRYKWFFASVVLFVGIVTTNFPLIPFLYKIPIPVIDTTVPTRFLSIFMFGGVFLATIGIDDFVKNKRFPKLLAFSISLLYIFLWVTVLIIPKFYPNLKDLMIISMHNLIIPTLLAIATFISIFLIKKFENISKILLLVIVVLDLFYAFHKITPFAPSQTVYPENSVTTFLRQNEGINRYWSYGSGYIQGNYQTYDMTFSTDGNDPLHLKSYGELLGSSSNGKIPQNPGRPDANLAPGYGKDGIRNNPYRQKLLNLLGIKYIVAKDELRPNYSPDTATFPIEGYSLAFSSRPWQIYENKNTLPRYFLTNDYVIASGQKAIDALYSIDLKNKLVLSVKPNKEIAKDSSGDVKLISYATQKILFQTVTTGNMLLFISDNYFPSWITRIDGKKTKTYLADYSFRAVIVPAGKHVIEMHYRPTFFTTGLKISAISLILFLISITIFKRYAKQK